MIQSFKDKATADLFHGIQSSKVRSLPTHIIEKSLMKLDLLNAAVTLDDLRSPPGNRLEALVGQFQGWHSIRINLQWRLVFQWRDSHAYDVHILDYHE